MILNGFSQTFTTNFQSKNMKSAESESLWNKMMKRNEKWEKNSFLLSLFYESHQKALVLDSESPGEFHTNINL